MHTNLPFNLDDFTDNLSSFLKSDTTLNHFSRKCIFCLLKRYNHLIKRTVGKITHVSYDLEEAAAIRWAIERIINESMRVYNEQKEQKEQMV